jgi:hypothetical protein
MSSATPGSCHCANRCRRWVLLSTRQKRPNCQSCDSHTIWITVRTPLATEEAAASACVTACSSFRTVASRSRSTAWVRSCSSCWRTRTTRLPFSWMRPTCAAWMASARSSAVVNSGPWGSSSSNSQPKAWCSELIGTSSPQRDAPTVCASCGQEASRASCARRRGFWSCISVRPTPEVVSRAGQAAASSIGMPLVAMRTPPCTESSTTTAIAQRAANRRRTPWQKVSITTRGSRSDASCSVSSVSADRRWLATSSAFALATSLSVMSRRWLRSNWVSGSATGLSPDSVSTASTVAMICCGSQGLVSTCETPQEAASTWASRSMKVAV